MFPVDFSHAVVPLGNQIPFHLVLEQGVGYDLFSFGLEDVVFIFYTVRKTFFFKFRILIRDSFIPFFEDILKGIILG